MTHARKIDISESFPSELYKEAFRSHVMRGILLLEAHAQLSPPVALNPVIEPYHAGAQVEVEEALVSILTWTWFHLECDVEITAHRAIKRAKEIHDQRGKLG